MIIAMYASVLGLLYVGLSVKTILLRRKLKIAIGDGGNDSMARAMRVHANFSEYVPIALILGLLLELSEGDLVIMHIVGASLLIGRLLHSYGVSRSQENFRFRVAGMVCTFTSICTSSMALLQSTLLDLI